MIIILLLYIKIKYYYIRSVYHQYIQFMFIIFLLNIFNKNIIIIFKNIYKLNINSLVDWDDMNHPEWNKFHSQFMHILLIVNICLNIYK